MKKYKLNECTDILAGGTPSTKNEKYWNGNIPWLSVKDFGNVNKIVSETEKTITLEGFNNCPSNMLHKGDLILSARGTVGKIAMVDKDMAFNQSCFGIRTKNNICNSDFIFYWYLNNQKIFKGAQQGNVFKSVTLDFFEKTEANLPSLEIQQKIAAVLSSLDDKIALNNRMNAKLEQMAKRLYDYWFVQFDFPVPCHSELVSESHNKEMLNQVQHDERIKPYKSSGGKMVWNEELKREIPAGWEVKKLGEIALVKRGTTITEKDTTKGNVKVVAGGLDFSYYHNQSNRKANCITVSGSGENAGFVNFWREPIFASDCSTVQCENDIDTMLCYFALKMQEKRFYRISHKSAQPHIYPKDVAEIPIVVPNEAVKSKISDFFLKSNWKIALIEKETQKLTALRDRLLPLLMNGQVEVN